MNVTSLPYSADLIFHYETLQDLPGFALLESTDRDRGRYDIVTACPYDVMIQDETLTAPTFFMRLEKALPLHASLLDFPFQGGAIGVFSYDLAQCLAGLDLSVQTPLLPQQPLAAVGFYDWAIIADHHTKTVSLVAKGEHPATERVVKDVLQRWNAMNTAGQNPRPFDFKPLISKQAYRHAFHDIQACLKAGRCYQVNLTQPFKARYGGDSWALYKQIRQHNPVPFSAYLKLRDIQVLSFSPERFLQMENRALLTSPIKGTIKRGEDVASDQQNARRLQTCEKNRAENIMIVDLLRNDLSKLAQPGSVAVPQLCELQSFASIHHLVSHVTATARPSVSMVEAFKACFPGASITGAPKLEAMKVIAEQEAFLRGIYCGSIGYFSSHGRLDSNIAIRTLVAQNQDLLLSAGGGLVIDSVCEREYEECFIKIDAICRSQG